MPKIKIASIEGNIGSGKSTLRELLERSTTPIGREPQYKIEYIDEPVSEWQTVMDKNGIKPYTKFLYSRLISSNFYKNIPDVKATVHKTRSFNRMRKK